jgi:hypothetical protein
MATMAAAIAHHGRRNLVPARVLARRRATAGAAAALVAALGLTAGASIGRDDRPAGPRAVSREVHVVQPGDTLWSIAVELAPQDDPRVMVDRLAELNGGSDLEVGQRLVLP